MKRGYEKSSGPKLAGFPFSRTGEVSSTGPPTCRTGQGGRRIPDRSDGMGGLRMEQTSRWLCVKKGDASRLEGVPLFKTFHIAQRTVVETRTPAVLAPEPPNHKSLIPFYAPNSDPSKFPASRSPVDSFCFSLAWPRKKFDRAIHIDTFSRHKLFYIENSITALYYGPLCTTLA
jgi:hypothetical protein